VQFEVLMAGIMKVTLLWHVMPCSHLVNCLHRYLTSEGSNLSKAGKYNLRNQDCVKLMPTIN